MASPSWKLVSRFGGRGRWSRPLALSIIVGLAAGLAAALLEWGLETGIELVVGRFPVAGIDGIIQLRWELLLLPAVGGLFSGVILVLLRNPSGHGTDALTRAFHRKRGEMALKAPAAKASAAVVLISTGGSAGPEGPIAALGAAIGSTVGRWFHVTPRERRILLIAGCAAGVGAIFRCPLGGAFFAVSVLYSEPDYESEAIMPSVVASVIGYSTFMSVWGTGEPLLRGANALRFSAAYELIPYAMLGLLCGLVSIFFSICFRFVERNVARARWMPTWLSPAIGGLATGALACVVPMVMDNRYRFIQGAVDGTLFEANANVSWLGWFGVFASLVLAKCLATSCSVGSGGCGGVLGPSLFIGGAVGASLGVAFEAVFPGLCPEPLRQALIPVGMGGVLAASMRVPTATIVMVTEMTGSYHLIIPLMFVCAISYMVGRRWGLNDEQVPTSAESPIHAADGMIHLLESWRARDFLRHDWPYVVDSSTHLSEIVAKITPGTHPTFAVVDDGYFQGLISLPDLDKINDPLLGGAVMAADLMTERLTTLHPDDDLYEALELFRRENHHVLPVISDAPSRQWCGMLTRKAVFKALSAQIEASRKYIVEEYSGLMAIDQEAEIDNLLRAVSPQGEVRLERLMVPLAALGKSIRENDFRNQFGIQILGLELSDGTLEAPPDLDRTLVGNERLLAVVASNREGKASSK